MTLAFAIGIFLVLISIPGFILSLQQMKKSVVTRFSGKKSQQQTLMPQQQQQFFPAKKRQQFSFDQLQ